MVRSSEDASSGYIRVMERVGFYRRGEPTQGVIDANVLRSNRNGQVDKRMKYSSVINPQKLNAATIYELSGSPCIYFKQLDQANPDPKTLADLRRLAWNQGLAPMLWIITPTSIRLYNAYARPTQTDEIDSDKHLIGLFEQTEKGLQQLHDFADRLQIESGVFWQKEKVKQIDRRQRVDVTLLDNLKEAEDRLVTMLLPRPFAQALLGRSIFVSYLQARGILTYEILHNLFHNGEFVDILLNKSVTYELFSWIQGIFNGNLFPLRQKQDDGPVVYEWDVVDETHLEVVHNLLSGTELKTGQGRLWSPYDFSVIPIELISSIYEMFVHADNSQIAKERSTYYTPINVVDLVLSEVFKQLPADANVLDMSCGSGVFLVESLRRLVARRIAGGENWSREMVRNTLYHQIYGIDISKGAIQIAAFSLYLTALELDPNPQLSEALKFQPLVDHNLFAADAFDETADFNRQDPFVTKNFQAIVGNPPWRRRRVNQLAEKYCQRRGYPLVRRSLDQAFLWRSGDFANSKTCLGLVLHSTPFFGHTSQALETRKRLLMCFSPRVIVNLSDLRQDELFPKSKAPAIVLIAEGCSSQEDDRFYLVNAERSESFKRHGIIEIGPENIKKISTNYVLSDTDVLKIASWGSARDMALIEYLRSTFPSLEKFVEKYKWKHGQGYQAASGSKDASELYGKKWLPSNKMQPFLIDPAALPPFSKEKLHRTRKLEIYKGPLVIATRGIIQKEFFAAYSPQDIVYTEEYYGVSIPEEEEFLAHYLNGILNSSLATYFFFMTASVWGVERDKVEPNDLLRLPVPWPAEENHSVIMQIVDIETRLRQRPTGHNLEELKDQLNKTVFKLYQLDEFETYIVEDAIDFTINLRMNREKSSALGRPSSTAIETYAQRLIGAIQPFFQTLHIHTMEADVFDVGRAPLQVVKFSIVPLPGRSSSVITVPTQGLEPILQRIAELLPQRVADKIYTRRVLRIYVGNDFYIVKPAQRRYWSRLAGLNDADEVLAVLHLAVQPPSMTSAEPVTKAASSEAR